MGINIFERLRNITWTRDKGGNNWYVRQNDNGNWGNLDTASNLWMAQNHPILSPALLFVSKLFSQAEFKVVHKSTGKERKDHWLIKLLSNPNLYQTQSDFLEAVEFIMIAQGKAVGYLKRPIGFSSNEDIDSIYILDSDLIKFPKVDKNSDFRSPMLSKGAKSVLDEQEIIYDEDGENLRIKMRDLLFFYDLPNMLQRNFYETQSRLDGLRQTLINTNDSLTAKNIILKSNGKELISGAGGSTSTLPLSTEDKKSAESLFNFGYGVTNTRKRGIVTNSPITYQSLHIALRDLGLDESVKVDGNLIYTALHIPKDIISLEAKKTTYNNFKESMVSYVQNEMQSGIDAFTDVLNTLIDDTNLKLVGTYEHLPIMQFILIERYEGISKKAKALNDLLITGIPKEVALEMCGFDKDLELEEIQIVSTNGTPNSAINGTDDAADGDIETETEEL